MQVENIPKGLNTQEAAAIIDCSASLLVLWRRQKCGPPFYRAGRRLIRYRLSDLNSWLQANTITPANVAETQRSNAE